MILQARFELLDHFSRLLDGDFDPSKFVELISGKFFSKGITQLATAQANDAQLIHDIVGHVVYGGRRSLIWLFFIFFAAAVFGRKHRVHIAFSLG
jgi:hypothetical protein